MAKRRRQNSPKFVPGIEGGSVLVPNSNIILPMTPHQRRIRELRYRDPAFNKEEMEQVFRDHPKIEAKARAKQKQVLPAI